MKTVLTVDVGNSRAKFGVFEIGAAKQPQVLAVTAVRLSETADPAAELSRWTQQEDFGNLSESVVAGSNPVARDQLLDAWPLPDCEVTPVGNHTDIPIRVDVEEPHRVGIDRLLTALAARRLVTDRQPVIVIDSGTATTVNLTTSDGTFRGGAILPGLRLSAHAMHDYTARLPLINTNQLCDEQATVDAPLPGRNTTQAMKSGLFWGQLGAVRELSHRLSKSARDDYGDTEAAVCVLTGGGGRQLVFHLSDCLYIDSLTLHGLAILSDN